MATCLFFPTGRSSYSASPTRESSHTHFLGHKHYFRPINSSMVNTFIFHLSILLLTFPQWLTVILTFLWRLVISKMLFYKYYHLMNLFKVVPFLVRKIIFQPLTMILWSILRSKKICGEIILQFLCLFHFNIVARVGDGPECGCPSVQDTCCECPVHSGGASNGAGRCVFPGCPNAAASGQTTCWNH